MTTRPRKKAAAPRLPTSMPFPTGAYQVITVPGLCSSEECYGDIDHNARLIRVDADLAYDVQLATLYHELVHAIVFEAEISLPERKEEKLCNAVAADLVFARQYA